MWKRIVQATFIGAFVVASSAACSATSEPETLDNGDRKDVEIAVFAGWPEGVAVSELWRVVLEEQGYDVTLTTADAAPAYAGVADGDYDLVLDSWMPTTHASYWEEYGEDLVNLGAWYHNARNTIVVNEDAPITSLTELGDQADLFGNRIVGMEPGAGLTKITAEQVIPAYGLENMDFMTSSTTALLTEIKAATDAGDNVVATLARPYWAYDAYPIRDLDDPEGALGEPEEIRSTSRSGFEDDYPTMTRWFENFDMGDEYLLPLCNLLFNENAEGDTQQLTQDWVDENRDWVDTLTS
ncbi:glycine betaine ABC transporter substrate-binding protein [Okibacterium endophyticum]